AAPPAARRQGEAMRKMEEARRKLEALSKRPLREEEKRKAEELARRQERVRNLTEELEKEFEQMQQELAGRSARSAQQNMQRAQRNLRQGQPEDALEDEDQAIKDLEQAERDLERAAEELKRLAEEELYVELQTELRKILEVQEGAITKATRELDEARRKKSALGREEVLRAKRLGTSQEELARRVLEVRKKLVQENVDVFVYVLDSVAGDMNDAAAALKEAETGTRTQDLQADAARKIRDLLEAFDLKRREARNRPPGGGGGGGGGGDGRHPLVPDLVQLNMMRRIQEELLRKTRDVRRQVRPDREDLTSLERQTLMRLSDEQGKLGDLMRKFIEKFEEEKRRQEGEPPGPGNRRRGEE
ncbi:MAG: hypothetical protein ACK44W_05420, partial [Planctomycetota bacterium]